MAELDKEYLRTKEDWENFWLPFPEQKAAAEAILLERLENDVIYYIKRGARRNYEKYAAVAPVLQEMLDDLQDELADAAAKRDEL